MHAVATIADLLADPERIARLTPGEVADLRATLARLDSLLLSRLLQTASQSHTPGPDRLLTVEQTAERLGMSVDWVRRNQRRLAPVRNGHALRFSEAGIERYIRTRAGR